MSLSKLSKIENGHGTLTSVQLGSIAKRLEFPSTFLVNLEIEDDNLLYLLNQLFQYAVLDNDKAQSIVELIGSNYYEYLINPKMECYFLILKATFLLKRNRLDEAEHIDKNYLQLYLSGEHIEELPVNFQSAIYYYYGVYHYNHYNYAHCLENFNKLISMVENITIKAAIIYNTGIIFKRLNRPQEAISKTKESITYYERLNSPYDVALSLNLIGDLYREINLPDEGKKELNKALIIAEKNEYLILSGYIYHNLGLIARMEANYEEANTYYLKAIKVKEITNDSDLVITYCEFIECKLIEGNLNDATNFFLEANSLDIDDKDHHYLMYAYNEYNLKTNNSSTYVNNLKQLISYFEKVNNPVYSVKCYTKLGRYYFQNRKYKKASEYFYKTLVMEGIGDLHEEDY
ncbi:hypothetical protein GH741_00465 [Aquibacillus halophilus]|uniref:Tetratricopeptide repeat protein n=1 Tax=Aquibacillus halophilus TaxID=930132 RepID=A0A6A8D5V8_9BACI|nr:hypothetical protein [Aquibacillus halophilus]MRH41145.1 hypothetical protein [Aquibacillus halophilus]